VQRAAKGLAVAASGPRAARCLELVGDAIHCTGEVTGRHRTRMHQPPAGVVR
jgi:hypothetical protein